jgi:tRNA dimethylallyltransferase
LDERRTPLLVVAGPTAGGKTALGVSLGEALGGEVVSADSMQIYRGMEIASAKPRPEEMRGVPHHLIGEIDPSERFSVARYAQAAREVIAGIISRGKVPILVGGAGLYIQAVAENLHFVDVESDLALRAAYALRMEREGGQALWEELRRCDPAAAERIHPNDGKRVLRALALFSAGGVTLSEQNARSRQTPAPYECRMLLLLPRERRTLYDRINARTEDMLARGLEEEARQFFNRNAGQTAAQAIGYKELRPYLCGECAREAAVERLKRETRRYAKRQISWFLRQEREWNGRLPGSCRRLWIEELPCEDPLPEEWHGMFGFKKDVRDKK